MRHEANYRRNVRYELMLGREATDAIAQCPVGYLPIGCLERHGDHLPMGLDVIKAHRICCVAAHVIGGVVFPAHFYSGIHQMTAERLRKYTGEWGNLYTDATAKTHLLDLVGQIAIAGIKVLVLYTGHYPGCQNDMVTAIAEEANRAGALTVVPFSEPFILQGDHGPCSLLGDEAAKNSYLRERFSILSAVYLPPEIDVKLYKSMTPVNTFRLILDGLFHTHLGLLEDRSYFDEHLYSCDFTDVTEMVTNGSKARTHDWAGESDDRARGERQIRKRRADD